MSRHDGSQQCSECPYPKELASEREARKKAEEHGRWLQLELDRTRSAKERWASVVDGHCKRAEKAEKELAAEREAKKERDDHLREVYQSWRAGEIDERVALCLIYTEQAEPTAEDVAWARGEGKE